MAFELPPLPYAENALEPVVSAKTMQFHHGKHHKKYVDTLNELTSGSSLEKKSLEELIQDSFEKADKQKIFNNAGQVWNHNFFWNCMSPNGGGTPTGELARRIDQDFGGFDQFKKAFADVATTQFGSGWAWLVLENNGHLKVLSTPNAVPPMVYGQQALLTCDVWEHAYYLDYQNRRPDFVQAFLDKLVNWDFAGQQLKNQGEGGRTGARAYNEGATATASSGGKVASSAKAAKQALSGAEGEQLREAEEKGRSHAAGEDPQLRKKA